MQRSSGREQTASSHVGLLTDADAAIDAACAAAAHGSGGAHAADADAASLALAVQAIAEAAQLGLGAADQLYPQTLEEHFAACEEEQPWRVAL